MFTESISEFSQIRLKIQKAAHVTLFWNLSRNPDKIHQNFAEKNAKFEFLAIELMKFINSIAKKCWRFLTKNMRLENGAKECIVEISTRAFQRVFTCKHRRRYSRERAPRSLGENIQCYSIVSLGTSQIAPATKLCRRFTSGTGRGL